MYLNSRYVDGSIYVGHHRTDVVYTVSREFPPAQEYVVYRWKAGDRIDILAGALGIPRLKWWQILDANPEIRSPTLIRPGDVIKVPRSS